jgi:hypothetical protein
MGAVWCGAHIYAVLQILPSWPKIFMVLYSFVPSLLPLGSEFNVRLIPPSTESFASLSRELMNLSVGLSQTLFDALS